MNIPQDISLGFHMDAWHFSTDISFYSLGYFIGIFIWMPVVFNGYFILGLRIFHFAFICVPGASIDIQYTKNRNNNLIIEMVHRMSGTAFRVHFIYLQKEISLEMTKKWNKPQSE
jgi:hypothetical protein